MAHWRGTSAQVPTGAWFPLALTAAVMAISLTWHSVYTKRQRYHREHASQLGQLLQPLPPDAPTLGPSQYRVCAAAAPHACLGGATLLCMHRTCARTCSVWHALHPKSLLVSLTHTLACRLDQRRQLRDTPTCHAIHRVSGNADAVGRERLRPVHNDPTCGTLLRFCRGQVLGTGAVVGLLPGVAVYYSDSLTGLPPVFEQLLDTAPALHRVVVFLHIRQVDSVIRRPKSVVRGP